MSHKQITNTDGSTNYKYTWYCTPQFTSYFSIFTLSTVCIWIHVLCFCAREVLASHHCGQASILPFESVKWPSSSTCNLGKNHLLRPGGIIKYFADDRCIVATKGTWGWKHQDVLFPPHRREPSYMAFFVPKVNVSAREIAWNSKHNTKIILNPRCRVSQLAFLIIAHIAWRASNQLGHCVPESFNMGGILLFCSENPHRTRVKPTVKPRCFSMNSLMSSRIMASSMPKYASDKALQSSVFPTPDARCEYATCTHLVVESSISQNLKSKQLPFMHPRLLVHRR